VEQSNCQLITDLAKQFWANPRNIGKFLDTPEASYALPVGNNALTQGWAYARQ
jgi:hypothetical protein